MTGQTRRRSSVSARSRHTCEGRKFWAMNSVYVCMCISTLVRDKRKREREIRCAKGGPHSGVPWVASTFPFSVLARKNLSANVGRGYVGEPSPLVPFGISPYVLHFLSLSVSLSHFNSALSHRRLRVSPFLRRSFSLRLLSINGVTVSRLSAMTK